MNQKKFKIMFLRVLFYAQGYNGMRKKTNLQAIFLDLRNTINLNLI